MLCLSHPIRPLPSGRYPQMRPHHGENGTRCPARTARRRSTRSRPRPVGPVHRSEGPTRAASGRRWTVASTSVRVRKGLFGRRRSVAGGRPVAPCAAGALACEGVPTTGGPHGVIRCLALGAPICNRLFRPSGGLRPRRVPEEARVPRRRLSEAHVSTQCSQAGQTARISPSDVDASRPGCDSQSPPEGPGPAVGVIWRIRGRVSFIELRRNGVEGARPGAIRVTYLEGAHDEPPRVGYALGRRVGNAVTRNRLRRRLRATVAKMDRSGSPTLRGGLYLVTPAPGATSLSAAELEAAVGTALDKVQNRTRHVGVGR